MWVAATVVDVVFVVPLVVLSAVPSLRDACCNTGGTQKLLWR